MLKVYVAGKYSADNVLDVLKNIGKGKIACANLFALGFAPFCTWADMDHVLFNANREFHVDEFREASLEWLRVSDAVLVISMSNGVGAEILEANRLKIPIFKNVADLVNWAHSQEKVTYSREDMEEWV